MVKHSCIECETSTDDIIPHHFSIYLCFTHIYIYNTYILLTCGCCFAMGLQRASALKGASPLMLCMGFDCGNNSNMDWFPDLCPWAIFPKKSKLVNILGKHHWPHHQSVGPPQQHGSVHSWHPLPCRCNGVKMG